MNINAGYEDGEIYKIQPPYAIQIEPVEGCNLACSFCGIQSIRENGANAEQGRHGKNSRPYRFMSVELATAIGEELAYLALFHGWNPRIELAMHGEPTMHSDLPSIVRALAKSGMQIMVTSNGGGLLKPESIVALMEAGVDTLALDDYKHAQIMQKIVPRLADLPYKVYRYPEDKKGNPHARTRLGVKRIVLINDISENTDGTHQLTNQGGNSFRAEEKNLKQRCAKPFRELSIRWNGAVALCCDDWRGDYKIGTIRTIDSGSDTLHSIWHHPRFEAARRRLYYADRDFGPCRGCNVKSPRVGLLPDKLGKHAMRHPDESSERHLKRALSGRPFTVMLRVETANKESTGD